MSRGMSIDSASLKAIMQNDKARMAEYRHFAQAFSYPKEEALQRDYDRLFRAQDIWLYGAEWTAANEFQRANALADISGFYRAFGVEPERDRPDLLSCELEFMGYLILKRLHALEAKEGKEAEEKSGTCLDAQRKFWDEHLQPAARGVADAILSKTDSEFYKDEAHKLLRFLESEAQYFK